MAECVRFEFYIPTVYRISPREGERPENGSRELDPNLLDEFINGTIDRFGGVTQSSSIGPSPFKGHWRAHESASTSVDYLTFVFGLVRVDRQDEAVRYFGEWKERLERSTFQEAILVVYHSVHVLGNFL